MFQNIATGVFVQLMTHSLIDLHSELKSQKMMSQEKEIIIENAWQEIALWQRKIIENYAIQLSPDSRKKDALDNIKEKLFDSDGNFPDVINIIQNIAQNNQGTEKLFTQVSHTLTRIK
jgi:malate synthase